MSKSEPAPMSEYYNDQTGEITGFPPEAQAFVDACWAGEFNEIRPDRVSPWRSPDVVRRPGSEIEGEGLFALVDIALGTLLAVKQGYWEDEQWVREHRDLIGGTHQQIDVDEFLVGHTPEEVDKNLVGYNHSCDPNAKIIIPNGSKLAYLVAKKPIGADREITTDYSVSMTSNVHQIINCRCGSPNCRLFINPTRDWQNPAFFEEHRLDFPTYMHALHWAITVPPEGPVLGWREYITEASLADEILLIAEALRQMIDGKFGELDERTRRYLNSRLVEDAGALLNLCQPGTLAHFEIAPGDEPLTKQLPQIIQLAKNIDYRLNGRIHAG